MAETQRDIDGARELIEQLLREKAKQFAVPLLDEAGNLTGGTFDIRLGEREQQPQPKRLLEHLEFLRQQGTPAVAGQPVPGFQVTDPFESEGFLDSISNVFKLSRERSLDAAAFEAITGKKFVDIEGFQPSKLEDISADVLSFFSVLDIATFFGGGGVAGLALRGIAKKAIAKGIAKGLTKKVAEAAAGKALIQVIPRGAASFGAHTAATNVLAEKLETGEMSLETLMDGLVKGGLLGAVVSGTGGAAGLLVPNLPKAVRFSIATAGEIAGFGAASPLIFEDRAPTLADFEHAAEFVVGFKIAGGVLKGAGAAFRKLKGENPAQAETRVKAERKKLTQEVRKPGVEFNDAVVEMLRVGAEIRARKPTVETKELESLAREARKFKSAEEFVKSQGEVVFRGGKPFNKKLFNTVPGLEGLAVTRDFETANLFAQALTPANKFQGAQINRGKRGIIEEIVIDKNAKILHLSDAPREMQKFFREDPLKAKERIAKWAKEQGFDVVNFGDGFELRLLNTDIFKTKSELINIFNQATKTPVKPVKPTVEAKKRFLKTVGKQVVERRLSEGEVVELTLGQARKTLGEEVLKGKQPAKVILAQAENGGKVLMHRISRIKKGKQRAGLNILALDNVEAFEKAIKISADRKLPLSISVELKDSPLFKTLQKKGLIEAPKEGLKFVKVNPPEQVVTGVSRETFQSQMAKAVPKASKEQIDAVMKIIDARAESAGETTAGYLQKRFPIKAILSDTEATGRKLAQIKFFDDGKAVITAFQKADVSSMVHELGHVFRRDLTGSELATAAKWAGGKGTRWTVAADEKFARGFEKFLQEGKAPTAELKTVFQKFKDWLLAIYDKVKLDIEITPEIRTVFDRLLTPEAKIKISPDKPAGKDALLFQEQQFPKVLFRESFAAKKLGPTFIERIKGSLKSIVPSFLKRVKKRIVEPESKELVNMAEDATFRHHQRFNRYEEALLSFGFDDIKTKAARVKLAEDIVAGRAPEYNKLLSEAFSEYKKAGGTAGEITPKNAGEFYFRRQVKDEIQVKLYDELDLLKKDLVEAGTFTEKAIASALLRRSTILQQGINHILKKGQIKSLREALKSSEKDLSQRFTTDQTWEKKRTKGLEWPDSFYEKDAGKILPTYFDSLAKRTAELEVFGVGDKKGIELLSKLENANFEEYELMRKALSMWSGQYDVEFGLKGKLRVAADIHAAFQVSTKIALGFAPLLNTTQWIISFMPKVGFWRTLNAGVSLFDPGVRKALRATGILRNSDMQALAMVLGRETIGRVAGFDVGRLAQFFSKWSGFTGINRLNNYWAAASIDSIIPKWMTQSRGTGKTAELAQKSLKDIGIDWKKPLTERNRSRAIFDFATKSQLQRNVFEEPLFLNDPRVRPFVLFKRFGIRQAAYITDMMRREISRGNYMPLIRFAAAGYAGGASLIWVMNTIKGLLSGEEQFRRTDSFFEGALQNFSTLGAFGFVSDMAELDRLSDIGPKVKFLVMPVFFSDVEKFYEGYTRFLKDWERYDDVFLSVERNAHSVFNIFGSLPRAAAKQLLTPIQRQRRKANLKGRERIEVLNLLLDGRGSAAADRVANWNRANPDKPIRMSDVSLGAIRKHLERLAVTKAGAFGEKGSREFRKAFREEKRKVRKRVSLTRAESIEFRRKLLLLRRKFNTNISNRKAG